MARENHTYVRCNGCDVECRIHEGMFSGYKLPEGWWEISSNGISLWDLCPQCKAALMKWFISHASSTVKT